MNKKLIAAAVVAGLAAPMAAQAGVTVYGEGQLQIVHTSNGTSKTTMQDGENSKLGVRWMEDLGGGMQAFGDAEFNVKFADQANAHSQSPLTARTQYIGLKTGFGTFTFGTVNSAYKTAGGVKYDAFIGTAIEARGNGGMLKTDFTQGAYLSNMIEYSNKMGMAALNIMYSPAKSGDTTNSTYHGSSGDLSAALTVGFNGGQAGVAYSKDSNAAGTTGAAGEKDTKVFGKYSFGGASTVLAQYENSKNAGNTTKVLFVGYRLKMPNMNSLAVQYGNSKPDGGNKTTYISAGIRHMMSKKTNVFVGYMNSKTDGSTANKVITVGMATAF